MNVTTFNNTDENFLHEVVKVSDSGNGSRNFNLQIENGLSFPLSLDAPMSPMMSLLSMPSSTFISNIAAIKEGQLDKQNTVCVPNIINKLQQLFLRLA